MSDQRREDGRLEEAASWFARLGRRAVTTDDLRAFREWRRTPANAASYAEVESTWVTAAGLADDPEIRAATQSALDRRSLRARLAGLLNLSWPTLFGLAGAVVALVLAFALGHSYLQPTYSTGVGEQRLVVLKDGSRVRLNTDSRVRVALSARERHIALLRGEAYFEVAHDASRPFLVDAGTADVRALGTKFDVRRDAKVVRVTLVEGSVRVRQDDVPHAWTLTPNQQLVLAPNRAAAPRTSDPVRDTSWTSGRLVFHGTPLAEAVAEVNRYATAKVELDDPRLASAPVSGVFDTGDTEAFVAAVKTLFDLKAVRAPDGATRLQPAAAS